MKTLISAIVLGLLQLPGFLYYSWYANTCLVEFNVPEACPTLAGVQLLGRTPVNHPLTYGFVAALVLGILGALAAALSLRKADQPGFIRVLSACLVFTWHVVVLGILGLLFFTWVPVILEGM